MENAKVHKMELGYFLLALLGISALQFPEFGIRFFFLTTCINGRQLIMLGILNNGRKQVLITLFLKKTGSFYNMESTW